MIDTISAESEAAAVLTRHGDAEDDDEFTDVNDDEGVTSMSVGLLASVLDIFSLLDVGPSPPSSKEVDFVQLLRIQQLAPMLLPTTNNDACDDRLLLLVIIDGGGANATATIGRLDDDDDATTVAAARRQVRNAIFFVDQNDGIVVEHDDGFPPFLLVTPHQSSIFFLLSPIVQWSIRNSSPIHYATFLSTPI